MSWSLVKFASNNKINLAISILIATLAIANLYYNVSLGGYFYYFISDTYAVLGVLLFVILLAVSSLIGCYFLSRFVGPLALQTKKSPFITSMYKIMLISQYVVLGLLIIITFQMLLFSEYTVGL